MKRSDCVLVYRSTTKGDVVKRSDCILVYGSTTKGSVVKRSDFNVLLGSLQYNSMCVILIMMIGRITRVSLLHLLCPHCSGLSGCDQLFSSLRCRIEAELPDSLQGQDQG